MVIPMYMDDYKRWLNADLEDKDLSAELALIEGPTIKCIIFNFFHIIRNNNTF